MPILNWRHCLEEELLHCTRLQGHVHRRWRKTSILREGLFAQMLMPSWGSEQKTDLRWPSQVTLSPPKAKLCKGHWQRWWVFAAGNLQYCWGHPSFWISKQHSMDFDPLIPAWSSIPFLTIPPIVGIVDGDNAHQTVKTLPVFLLFTASPAFHSYTWEKETARFFQFIEIVPPEPDNRFRNYEFNPLVSHNKLVSFIAFQI